MAQTATSILPIEASEAMEEGSSETKFVPSFRSDASSSSPVSSGASPGCCRSLTRCRAASLTLLGTMVAALVLAIVLLPPQRNCNVSGGAAAPEVPTVSAQTHSSTAEAAMAIRALHITGRQEAADSAANPFAEKTFYVNPSYRMSIDSSIATANGTVKATLEAMRNVSSAFWIDSKAKLSGNGTDSIEGILADAASKSPPELVVFVVYNLPNRDCHARASNGEICCYFTPDGRCDYYSTGDCADGILEYQKLFIDPMAAILRRYSGLVPIVLVIEPDSLPNLSSDQADRRCSNVATIRSYKLGIPYAIRTLAAAAPEATIYLDAGHGGWLGRANNMRDYVTTVKYMDATQYIRGFATNVAGYQHLGKMCPTFDWCLNNQHANDPCCEDPCGLTQEWNPSQNELNYALQLRNSFSEAIPGFVGHVIIDTGRNGVQGMRSQCANWCNVRGAGVGLAPTNETANPDIVDAYFWLKTPGESDGCTQILPDGGSCPRFDADCGSQDSIGSRPGEPHAPEAGQWFDFQVKMLAANARLH